MGRKIERLSALAVSRATRPGMHPDGNGLYLQVSSAGARSWVLRYKIGGRSREMGLGSLNDVTLSQARQRATEARNKKSAGIDPIDAKVAERASERAAAAKTVTFSDATDAYIRSHKAGWRNAKHGDQWRNTLKTYAYPLIGRLPVQEIDAGLVQKVLEPIWETKTETASRVRGRIESILDWATARGHRKGDNPARWRGHLSNLLPKPTKVRRVRHHPALPYAEIGDFMEALRKQSGDAAQALELLILTATRTSEVIAARWDEIDVKAKVWAIPAERIKAGREHRIPLCARAVTLLKERLKARQQMPDGQPCPHVFPGKPSRALSNNAILSLLKRMNRQDLTAHGFRSTFRDWAAEQTNFPRDVAEMALAHAIGDKVEAAYRRGDLFEKRKRLMDAWAGFTAIAQPKSGKVLQLRERQP